MSYDSLFSKTPATFVDQYAETMAEVDFSAEDMNRISTSQVFFRQLVSNGFQDGNGKDLKVPYMVFAGLGPFMEWLDNWQFTDKNAAYLASLKDPGGQRLFPDAFIDLLKNTKLKVDIDAMPEGELVFPDEPVVRLTGPHYQVQMLEAALLNLVTAHTGWATIASQFWLAAQRAGGEKATLLEFGARRNPEWGGLGAARSAYLAGWDGTSNMYAGETYGIPTAGTMAHAFIMVQKDELSAFRKWAKNKPHLGVFLVDTFDTEQGIRNAIQVCKEEGIKLRGVRLDSGDIDELSRLARDMLDEAGFKDAIVMASDSLSIGAIHQVYQVKGAPLNSFGIGGNYVTRRQDHGGTTTAVMKAAVEDGRDLMKFSNTREKSTIPGVQNVIRFTKTGADGATYFAGDAIVPKGLDLGEGKLSREITAIPQHDESKIALFPAGTNFYTPLEPVMRDGQHVQPEFAAQDAKGILKKGRERFLKSMAMLDPRYKEILSPKIYFAGVESELLDKKTMAVRANNLNIQRRRQTLDAA